MLLALETATAATRGEITPVALAVALGLALFYGLAFEEIYAPSAPSRPGGVRTFPLLTLAGTVLFAIEPDRALAFVAGLVVLGVWLNTHYRARVALDSTANATGAEIVIPLSNVLAYALGPVAIALPLWVAVTVAVSAVLLLSARDWLHELARRVPLDEITTLGKFLILIGVVLPLMPAEPITELTPITPRQVWLAIVVVSSLSYASYLLQKFVSPRKGLYAAAVLGGLYSSTATTVVLSRRARDGASSPGAISAAITIATAMMYLRLAVVVAVFSAPIARLMWPWLLGLAAVAALLALGSALAGRDHGTGTPAPMSQRNPLELGSASLFALLFVAISLATSWIATHAGDIGVFGLAAVVGVTDIDPFVLSIVQGGVPTLAPQNVAAAVLIAASSNDLLKAGYALGFARGAARRAAVALAVLAALGVLAAWRLHAAAG